MAVTVHGTCEPPFAAVAEELERNLVERGEVGAAVAAYADGRLVVDLWAGLADAPTGRPWARDTIAHAYSVSKPFAATCLLLLVDRGVLSLDTPVCELWPAYGAHGKEGTLVRHVLTHQTGLVFLRDPLPPDALFDRERLAHALAAEEPLWPPGTHPAELAGLFGHLVGELVLRADGRPLPRFLAEEVAGPWGLDFHVGLGPAELRRAATLLDEGGAWRRSIVDDPRPLLAPSLSNPPGILEVDVVNSRPYRIAEIAAVNGHGTARAIARFYGGLAAGGILDGVRLLRDETVAEMLRPQVVGRDRVLDDDVAWGLGLHADAGDGSFGRGGIGGFIGYGIRRAGLAAGFGYATCALAGYERAEACADAFEGALADR